VTPERGHILHHEYRVRVALRNGRSDGRRAVARRRVGESVVTRAKATALSPPTGKLDDENRRPCSP